MCVSFGTTFNHDSPRQEDSSVARKITSSVGKIRLGQQESFELGNLDSRHGWGHAKEYVEGMWRILQHNEPGDFVLATGRADSVRNFCELAFADIGQTIVWEGEGVNEVGRDEATGAVRVSVSPDDYHPAEVGPRYEDVMGAKTALGWEAKISLNELGKEMVASDIELMNPNLAECEA